MLVDGVQQEYVDCASELTFAITDVGDRKFTNIEIILEEGYPIGHSDFITGKEGSIDRAIFDVQPSLGSDAGTLLTLTGSGFGTQTELDGFIIQAKIDGTWETLCD